MERLSYTAKALLLGLVVAQALATAQVYLSDLDLYVNLMVMKGAGYLVVPNEKIMPCLRDFGPAFCGGLFFTLSVGAGISLLSLASAWIWERLFFRRKLVLGFFVLAWLGLVAAANGRGFSLAISSYLLLIPPVVFVAVCRWLPPPPDRPVWIKRMVHAASFGILAIVWVYQVNGQLFVDVRDYLLLANPLGRRINNFYYDYTLYPAEVFKSLDQKLLKTVNMEALRGKPLGQAVEKALLEHDYLPVREESAVDLRISQQGNDLVFAHQGETILRTSADKFLAAPGQVLRDFSSETDRYAFFREFTFLSLVIALPITLYLLLFALLRLGLSFIVDVGTASLAASAICLLVGIGLLVYFSSMRGQALEANQVAEALQSHRWQVRVGALKAVDKRGLELGDVEAYKKLLASPEVAERYWLVRALGSSRRPEAYNELVRFLDDPQPNVVAMAFYALGRRGDPGAVDEIMRRVKMSAHWYSQWYGYKAMRTLGWKQAAST